MNKKIIKEIISWVLVFGIAILVALFINRFVLLNEKIPTGSMENTIMTGDKIMTFRLAYLFDDPKRGDIVVFPFPDDESVDYIKRIIGLPGEKVSIKDGVVSIDDEELVEDYVREEWDYPKEYHFDSSAEYEASDGTKTFIVPEDSYFMMGDNRNNSEDSRFWTNKFVSKDKIKSKAFLRYPNFKWIK